MGLQWQINPDAITDFEKANRTAWDQVITGAGGTIMNTAAASATGDSYWASRETSSGTSAFYVRFGKPLAWDKSNAKKDGKRFVVQSVQSRNNGIKYV